MSLYSFSLLMTTMCLRYPTAVVACVCIHVACQWSSFEVFVHWIWPIEINFVLLTLQSCCQAPDCATFQPVCMIQELELVASEHFEFIGIRVAIGWEMVLYRSEFLIVGIQCFYCAFDTSNTLLLNLLVDSAVCWRQAMVCLHWAFSRPRKSWGNVKTVLRSSR